MFRIHMLPAMFGDCLWLDYGEPVDPKVILIDAGTAGTWKPLQLKIEDRIASLGRPLVIELFVVTHVDRDHIGGAIKLLEQLHNLKVTIREVWFNGWHHLNKSKPPLKKDDLGPKDGERLSSLLLEASIPWNGRFGRRAVVTPESGELPAFTFEGMEITLLSPDQSKLDKMIPLWIEELAAAMLEPGDAYEVQPPDVLGAVPVEILAGYPFKMDTAEANGTSIAFLASYMGKTVLFGADAHPDILVRNLRRVNPAQLANGVTALKLSHHGSKGNTNDDLVRMLGAEHYLVSTNGSIYGHPDDEAIARILKLGPDGKRLHFNYRRRTNWRWTNEEANFSYEARYGTDEDGLTVDL
jgi:metal-dependent hydrolase (beta-lactamase superfamily II)